MKLAAVHFPFMSGEKHDWGLKGGTPGRSLNKTQKFRAVTAHGRRRLQKTWEQQSGGCHWV